ncbi:MAG: VWA domain-containing protein [Acidobacteria bacterium]|nr:VWA domain-containing protein [Acidobacteriota bacterium]
MSWQATLSAVAIITRYGLALTVLLLFGSGAFAQQEPKSSSPFNQAPQVRLDVNLVTVPVTVMDPYERFVTGLRKEHFELYDEKVKQDVVFFAEEDAPITIGIVFDVSGSMKEKIQRARLALRRFIDTSHPDDEFFLIGFNERAELLQDFTSSGDQVTSRLVLKEPAGRTALYDACYLAIEKLGSGQHKRRALLIISDGMDNSSRYTYRQLRDQIKETGVQIYAIGIFGLFHNSTQDEAMGRSILEEITSITGGRAFFPDTPVELDDVITRIALELRHQYSLGFYPTNVALNGQWHQLRVKVNPPRGLPRLRVRGREGYYAGKKQ